MIVHENVWDYPNYPRDSDKKKTPQEGSRVVSTMKDNGGDSLEPR